MFILNVFQPFGTQHFTHDYKFWILTGYGIVSAISIIVYYGFSLFVLNRHREKKWTVFYESIDLLIAMIFSLIMCYLYYAAIFQRTITLPRMWDFVQIAFSVSLLPVAGLFGYIYYRYQGITRSSMKIEHVDKQTVSNRITLNGTNKNERIEAMLSQILYIKAEDNYIILYLQQDDIIQMHMIRSTMKQIEQQINNDQFFKCHRSYIVNLHQIDNLSGNKNSTKAKIKNCDKLIPISRSKVDEIRGFFNHKSQIQ